MIMEEEPAFLSLSVVVVEMLPKWKCKQVFVYVRNNAHYLLCYFSIEVFYKLIARKKEN